MSAPNTSLLDAYRASVDTEKDACALLARDLMRGDARSLKQGYTFSNALYAACELSANDRGEIPGAMLVCAVAERLHNLLAEEAGVR